MRNCQVHCGVDSKKMKTAEGMVDGENGGVGMRRAKRVDFASSISYIQLEDSADGDEDNAAVSDEKAGDGQQDESSSMRKRKTLPS